MVLILIPIALSTCGGIILLLILSPHLPIFPTKLSSYFPAQPSLNLAIKYIIPAQIGSVTAVVTAGLSWSAIFTAVLLFMPCLIFSESRLSKSATFMPIDGCGKDGLIL